MTSDRLPTIRRMLALLVMACVIPASLLASALIYYDYQRERERLVRDSKATARAMAAAVDTELASTQAALFALGTSPLLAEGDFAGFQRQANQVLRNHAASAIVLVDSQFRQRVNTLRPFGEPLATTMNPTLRAVFQTGRPVTTDVYVGPISQRLVIAVAVPVQRNDKVEYVLTAGLWPDRLSEVLARQHLPAGWIGAIFDRTGTIVARTHEAQRFVGQKGSPALVEHMRRSAEGAFDGTTVEGFEVLSVFSKSSISSWTVAIGIPRNELTAELRRSLSWLVAAIVALLATSLALAWRIGGRIAVSVHSLTAPAMALGLGEQVSLPPSELNETDAVGRALARASGLLSDAKHRASHDGLTGLANRALFEDALSRNIAAARRSARKLAIIYVDLDLFKPVNDQYGHAAGDEVLRLVAARLKNGVRESDLVARLGGDEFGVLLPEADAKAADTLAQKLVASLCFPYAVGPIEIKISASAGIAAYPECGASMEELTRDADVAMYRAKTAARRPSSGLAA